MNKEIRKLSRFELIEIIYHLQLNIEELEAENKKLKEELDDKRLRVNKAGNLASAVLEINKVMESAQHAADMYLDEIREIRDETKIQCSDIIKETREKTDKILSRIQKEENL